MTEDQQPDFMPIPLIPDEPIESLDDDFLGLEPWAKTIAHSAIGTKGPFTIGVHASWGHGKTSVLRLAKSIIDDQKDPKTVTVWFNAWQFERENHPLFSLIAAIIQGIKTSKTTWQKVKEVFTTPLEEKLENVFKKILSSSSINTQFVNIDLGKLMEDPSYLANNELRYMSAFSDLEELTKSPDMPKIVVFIDDLDRCQPENAVHLLENIKLILSQRGFVFVMAVEQTVVEAYLTKRYTDFCGEEHRGLGKKYLEKIIQLPITIPPHHSRFENYVNEILGNLPDEHNKTVTKLKNLKDILRHGTGNNPRSLVRLLNSCLIDFRLWPLIDRKGSLHDYQELDDNVAAALVINSVMNMVLGDGLRLLVYKDGKLELGEFLQGSSSADSGPDENTPDRPKTPEEKILDDIRRTLSSRTDLVDAIKEHGKKWLEDRNLRVAVYEFAQSTSAAEIKLPKQIEKAIREQLELSKEEPITISHIKETTKLFIDDSSFMGNQLSCLSMFSNLKFLGLSTITINGPELDALADLDELGYLNLGASNISDNTLAYLKPLKHLVTVCLAKTKIGDAGIEHILNLESIRQLELDDCKKITDEGFCKLQRLGNLERLFLTRTNIGDEGLQCISNLSKLELLCIGGTKITDNCSEYMRSLDLLKRLIISDTSIGDKGLENMQYLYSLESLDVSFCKNIKDDGLEHISQIQSLKELTLSGCTGISDTGLKHLAEMKFLTTLIMRNREITKTAVDHIFNIPRLDTLITDECHFNGIDGLDKDKHKEALLAYIPPDSPNEPSNNGPPPPPTS